MRPIASPRRKFLTALIAASVLLALALACAESAPPAVWTATPAPENADAAVVKVAATPTPVPAPSAAPTPAVDDRDEAIAAAVAEAVATALAGSQAGQAPTPTPIPVPSPIPTVDDRDAEIAAAVAAAVATALAGVPATPTPNPDLGPTPTPTPYPTPTPTPDPVPTSDAGATATAAAKINAAAAALSEAVSIALDQYYNGRFRGDREGAIAHAVSVTGADPDALDRAMTEVLGGAPTPLPVDPAAKDISDDLAAAVTLALEYIINSPLDREGAVAHAVSMTGADAGAVADALNKVLNNPVGFPNVNTQTAIDAGNAVAEASAIAAARDRADADEAARQAAAKASAQQMATATAQQTTTPTPGYTPTPVRRYDSWNDHEWLADPKPWWRESNPYDCDPPPNPNSPWADAGMTDLGGQDPLSLIRYFGNGSYVRYGLMGFEGCTLMNKHPERTHLDMPADPAYYSLGDLEIAVDIARVPANAQGWDNDDRTRVDMSMAEAVDALNDNVAAYFRKISGGKLRMRFVAGHDFEASGAATPQDTDDQWLALIGVVGCDPDNPDMPGCRWGRPGALNRFILNDVSGYTGGSAWNGYADFGLVSLKYAVMMTLVHEIGHGWMFWPHSYTELTWKPNPNGARQKPNFYSNPQDFMSELTFRRPHGWHQDMPATLAINRYAAGWIEPEDVALHLSDAGTYTLAKPRESGYQFLVIHSGRPGAFTTLEVLDERNDIYRDTHAVVYDPASPGQKRAIRYEGVMVSRYDQTTGTGVNARAGPALYNSDNPNYETDVGYGRDDYSVIADGESRSIGGGLTVRVSKNADGSYDATVSGGKIAEFSPWCIPIWFPPGGYDTGCSLEEHFGGGN